jgi:hypothetical protein
MARFVRAALVVAIASTSFSALIGAPASGASATVTNAVTWLRTQQQPDGGFEVAGYPGFETSDAVLALAQAAQTSGTWNAAAARAAVLGTSTASGKTPLDELDTYASVSSGPGVAGVAGKLVTLVANPLALDPAAFDPSGNGATDLVAKLGEPGVDGKFGLTLGNFNGILYAARGYATFSTVPPATIAVIRAAQKSDGSWSYDGDPTLTNGGADTTGTAVQALLAAGIAPSDADVDEALDYLEAQQQPDGGWPDAYATENPNSTALAMLALSEAGRTAPLADGSAYLVSQQLSDGRIASANDVYGINTGATTQAIQALVRVTIPDATSFATPTTIPAATGGGALTLETDAGTLANVTAVDPATLGPPPAGVTFPRGLVSFQITGLPDGATATIRLVLPVGTSVARYFKFNGSAWSDATSLATFAGNVVTLFLTDGGAGDEDGLANGVIVDPGGPSVAAAVVVAGAATAAPDAIVLVPRFTG